MYVLDTNICIFLINSKLPELAKRITDSPIEQICISAITQAELEYGVAKSKNVAKNAAALTKFLSTMNVLSFDSEASEVYGKIRASLEGKGKVIGNMDMLIAAHAKSIGGTVVTNNTDEFRRIDGLKVEDWTS